MSDKTIRLATADVPEHSTPPTASQSPPFRLQQQGGRYELVPQPGTVPTDEEAHLAEDLGRAFACAQQEPASWEPYLQGLVNAAKLGLTTKSRDTAKARADLDALNINFALLPGNIDPGAFILYMAKDPAEICFRRNPRGAAPTEEQIVFLNELERQERLIRNIHLRGAAKAERETKAAQAVQKLMEAGKIALQEAVPDLRTARFGCSSVVQDTLDLYGQMIRRNYLVGLAAAYLLGTIVVLLLISALGWAMHGRFAASLPPEVLVRPLRLVLLGFAMVSLAAGAWLSSVVFVEPDGPEVIGSIVAPTLSTGLRAAYVLGFGLFVILMLHERAVVFALGSDAAGAGFSTEHVLHHLVPAVITGALLGVGARALPNAVVERSANLIAALSNK